MASRAILFITLALIFNFLCISLAFDPRPLLDFCVANSPGNACKDPNTVTANDFFLSGLDRPIPFNPYGFSAAIAFPPTVPGFNSLGLAFSRLVFAPNGYIPPHTHPRASEVFYCEEGMFEIGFVTSYPDYKYYSKVVRKGGVFIAPIGLVHTVRNIAKRNSALVVAYNSQNPGFVFIPDNAFAAKPAINATYLAGAFKLDENTVKYLQTEQWL